MNERKNEFATKVDKSQDCKIEWMVNGMRCSWNADGMRMDHHGSVESANHEVDSDGNVDVHAGH